MGNTQNVTVKGGDGPAMLAIVAVVGIAGMFFVVVTFLVAILIGAGLLSAGYLGYRVYQLHTHRVIALAAIQANMQPPPMPGTVRQIPPMRELMWGRNHG